MYDDTRTEEYISDKNTPIAHWPNYKSGSFIKFAYNNDAYNNHLSIDEKLMIQNFFTILEWKNKYDFDEKLAICLLYKIKDLLKIKTNKELPEQLDYIISEIPKGNIFQKGESEVDDEIIRKTNEHQLNSKTSHDDHDLDVQIDLSDFDKENIPEFTFISRFELFTLMNEFVDISKKSGLTIEDKQLRILKSFYTSSFYTTIQPKPNSQTVNAIINLIINIQGIDESIRMDIDINRLNIQTILNQYETVEMIGDGACLFRAFSYFVYNRQEDHFIIREKIVDYMNDNIEKYTIDGIKLVDDTYIDNMRKLTKFGGQYELLAFATLYKYRIEIFDERYGTFTTILPFDPITPEKTIHLKYSGGNHYDCLIPKNQFE